MVKSNLYENLHNLKKYMINIILEEKVKLGIRKFDKLLEDSSLIAAARNFTTEVSSTNINTLLLIYDKLGYDLKPIKRKKDMENGK